MNMRSIDPPDPGVKTRRYDTSRRRAEAARTHARVLEVAEQLLLSDGYAVTSVAAVATAAGVSTELIYKTFGGKAGLVREIQRRGLLGAGPVPAQTARTQCRRPTSTRGHFCGSGLSCPRRWLRGLRRSCCSVRSAAATDADLADLLKQMAAQRLERMALNAERLTAHAGVRRDLTVEQIRDVMWTYTSPDLYDLLVTQRGWTVDQYRDFLFRGMSGQLLES